MAALDSERESISYSMREPSLREQAPSCLQRAGPLRGKFIAANDRTRDEKRQGSQMVKRDKPFPELRPNYAHYLKRTSFNQEWIREQRAENIQQFETQRQIAPQQKQRSEPLLAR